MSEKIYAWLLRLYPSRFREVYGEEALQLFRDRMRDENGFLPRLRLWLDLLCDLALSLTREYFHVQRELASYSAHVRTDGVPSLLVLEDESLGPGALFVGGVLALGAVVSFSALLNHGATHVPLSALIRPAKNAANDRAHSFSARPPEPVRDSREQASGPATTQPPGMVASSSQPDEALASNSESSAVPPGNSSRPFVERSPRPSSDAGSTRPEARLSSAERTHVVNAAAAILEKYSVDRDNAKKIAGALRAHQKNGDDNAATDGPALAALLTQQMREVNPDRHVTLDYSETPLPHQQMAPTPEDFARYREVMLRRNCTFEKIETLPDNIGYLKLSSFPDDSVCGPMAKAAMASLNDADAIIFDLRDNRGGEPAMVSLLASYLFDHPEYLYNPRENVSEESWTHSPVHGNKLADKPVYVLTSGRTFSGAEQFCYDLKMLKRATLVGETTGGGAHSGVWHRIDDHFGMGIPETKAINPYSKIDWAEIGVEPDVKVKAADALETAVKLAKSKLRCY